MAELIDIYTKQGNKIGTVSKREYYSSKEDDVVPWIKCCTCFVIDEKSQKILFEKRGKRFLDPGKLDLCSGHVRSGELPFQAMIRELDEELSIPLEISQGIHHLGFMSVDYTDLEDITNKKNLKALVDIYALKIKDISKIEIDNNEAISKGWLNFEDTVGFIRNSMTRLPYESKLKSSYDKIFDELSKYMFNRNKETEKTK